MIPELNAQYDQKPIQEFMQVVEKPKKNKAPSKRSGPPRVSPGGPVKRYQIAIDCVLIGIKERTSNPVVQSPTGGADTSVPVFLPVSAFLRAFGSHKFTTRMGMLLSMHKLMAVLSITFSRRLSTSM
jgi:hypothetical protein